MFYVPTQLSEFSMDFEKLNSQMGFVIITIKNNDSACSAHKAQLRTLLKLIFYFIFLLLFACVSTDFNQISLPH